MDRPDDGGTGDAPRAASEGGSAGTDREANGETDGDEREPTPQSAALRRQQRYVGIGGAVLAGVALATATFQQFPERPVLAALAGVAGAAVVLWIVRRSIFPGPA